MRIVSKTYILIGILIAIAAVNLFILYGLEQESTIESYSIIRAGDLKQKTETIASLANSIANGNDEDREIMKVEIQEFENYLQVLKNGGALRGQNIVTIPDIISTEYGMLVGSWISYKNNALTVQDTSVFDKEVIDALNYVLDKNEELILITHDVKLELEQLGRDHNRHKQIAAEMENHAEDFGRQVLLLSIGEEEKALQNLANARLSYEIDFRKLTGQSISELQGMDENHLPETLIEVPRANSQALRELEPLWEAVQLRIKTLEDSSLLSTEFQLAKNNLETSKGILLAEVDSLLDAWNDELSNKNRSEQQTIQILTIVDIVVFGAVVFVIRQSLNPLQIIARGLSQVKEGIYGEKINYKAKDEIGELVNSFNIMSDTIKEKEEEAKKTDIAKDEFLAMITHELKTPLVPIQGYADLLLSEHLGKLTDKQKERLAIIKSSATSLLEIISDLLDAQKLELGQLKIKKQNLPIKTTIEKAIEIMRPTADENGVKLAMNSPDVVIEHDPERIIQVLTNLIKNSLKAVKQKTGAVQINVQESPTEVKVSVNDNGIGIPADKQKDLFKKFYQVDASLTRERGGSGLGLAICKGIINHHGGKIWVESTPNVGTTFSFTINKK